MLLFLDNNHDTCSLLVREYEQLHAGIIDAAYAMCNDNALIPHIAVVSCCYQNRSTMNTADT